MWPIVPAGVLTVIVGSGLTTVRVPDPLKKPEAVIVMVPKAALDATAKVIVPKLPWVSCANCEMYTLVAERIPALEGETARPIWS